MLSRIGEPGLRYVSTLVTIFPWTCSTKIPLPWICLLRASYGYWGLGQYVSHSGFSRTGVPGIAVVNIAKLMAMHMINVFMCTAASVQRGSSPRSAETANACVILSSSRNALSISSDRTTNLLPSSRCASTIQIIRPSLVIAERQPQLHPALLRLSAMISQYFTQFDSAGFALHTATGK